MARTLALWVLISLMLYPSIARLYIISDFLIHQDYIAEVLCINKDKPELKCEGKCFLMTQLAKNEEQERSDKHQHINKTADLSLFILPQIVTLKTISNLNLRDFAITYFTHLRVSQLEFDIFHPPQLYS